jgi:hypothetical protein
MSDITKQLTAEEVDVIILRIRTSATLLRHDLLALYDGNAHRAKGSASFEEFCRTYLEISLDATHIRHLRRWARIERDIAPPEEAPVLLTQLQYRALSPFEDVAEQRAVFKEFATALATGNVRSAGLLENIAARRLKALQAAPGATAAAPSPAPPVAPSPAAPGATAVAAPDPAPGDPWADEEEEDETDQEPIVAVYVSTTTTNRADRRKITCRLPDGYMVEVIVPVRDLR